MYLYNTARKNTLHIYASQSVLDLLMESVTKTVPSLKRLIREKRPLQKLVLKNKFDSIKTLS